MDPQNQDNPATQVEAAAHQTAREQTASRPVRRARTYLFQAYLLGAILAFSVLAFFASTVAYFPVDLTITHTVQLLHADDFEPFMVFISWFGYLPQSILLVLGISGLLYLFGFHWEALCSLLVVAAETLINLVIKLVIQRPRPAADLVHVFTAASNYSFPSGHVMFYTAYFGFLLFLVYTLLRRSIYRTILLCILGALILLIGLSRIYLGDHWASDVLGGYLLGSLILVGAVFVYRWGKPRFFARQPVAPE